MQNVSPDYTVGVVEALHRALARHPNAAGLLLSAVMFPVALVSTSLVNRGPHDLPYVVWALGYALALAFAVTRPEVALLACVLPVAVQLAVTDMPLPINVAPLLCLACITARRPWRRARWWAAGTLLLTTTCAVDWTLDRPQDAWDLAQLASALSLVLVLAGLVLASVLAGRTSWLQRQQARTWHDLAVSLQRDHELAVALSTSQERTRIATDMHDILAHSLAVIAVQTDAARLLLRQRETASAETRTAIDAVEAAHRTAVVALRDTRQLVSALTARDDHRAPQPTLAELPDLVSRIDPTRRRITLQTDLDLTNVPLPRPAQVAVYRMVQEALTNVMRHAGPQASAQVRLRPDDGWLEVAVTDNGRGSAPSDRTGHGLLNMGQRVRSVGGEMRAGTAPGGGFAVAARIPLEKGSRL